MYAQKVIFIIRQDTLALDHIFQDKRSERTCMNKKMLSTKAGGLSMYYPCRCLTSGWFRLTRVEPDGYVELLLSLPSFVIL